MTNDELQQYELSLRRFCRGPRLIPEAPLLSINQKRIKLMEDRDVDGMRDLAIELAATLDRDGSHLASLEPLGSLNLEVVKLLDVRVDCGEDITELRAAPPYDGELHEKPCPKCGYINVWRAAVSDEHRAAADEARTAKLAALGV